MKMMLGKMSALISLVLGRRFEPSSEFDCVSDDDAARPAGHRHRMGRRSSRSRSPRMTDYFLAVPGHEITPQQLQDWKR